MTNIIEIICENLGGKVEVPMGTPLSEVAKRVAPGPYPFLAALVNNRIKELYYKIYTPVSVRFVDITSFSGIRVYQRTSWFILQKAVRDLFPGKTLHIRHSMGQNGFYCEVEGIDEFSHEQAAALEGRMRYLVAQDLPISRMKILTSEVRARYAAQGLTDKIALLDTARGFTATSIRSATPTVISTARWRPQRASSTGSASNPTTTGSTSPCRCARRPTGSTRTSSRKRCSASSRNTSPGCGSWACPPWAPSTPRCSRATRAG